MVDCKMLSFLSGGHARGGLLAGGRMHHAAGLTGAGMGRGGSLRLGNRTGTWAKGAGTPARTTADGTGGDKA